MTRPTPKTDAEALAIYAQEIMRLERQRNEAVELLKNAQALRPILLARFGYVPESILDYCNQARAFLERMKEE